ncbi:MAG: hypothetical protein RJB68_2164 [Pseudomonadota bacterium]|jgi:hypothetical protein
MKQLIQRIKAFFSKKPVPTAKVDPKHYREQFCSKGQHDWSGGIPWWKAPVDPDSDTEEAQTRMGRVCAHCGKWDIAE